MYSRGRGSPDHRVRVRITAGTGLDRPRARGPGVVHRHISPRGCPRIAPRRRGSPSTATRRAGTMDVSVIDSKFDPPRIVHQGTVKGTVFRWLRAGTRDGLPHQIAVDTVDKGKETAYLFRVGPEFSSCSCGRRTGRTSARASSRTSGSHDPDRPRAPATDLPVVVHLSAQIGGVSGSCRPCLDVRHRRGVRDRVPVGDEAGSGVGADTCRGSDHLLEPVVSAVSIDSRRLPIRSCVDAPVGRSGRSASCPGRTGSERHVPVVRLLGLHRRVMSRCRSPGGLRCSPLRVLCDLQVIPLRSWTREGYLGSSRARPAALHRERRSRPAARGGADGAADRVRARPAGAGADRVRGAAEAEAADRDARSGPDRRDRSRRARDGVP